VIPHLRRATRADVQVLLEIESGSFPQPHWSSEDFFHYPCVVVEVDNRIVGFIVVRETFSGDEKAPPEREILNIAIESRFRRLGLATLLLQNELRSDAVYFLEVRESNIAARALYAKFGFVEIGRREEYYGNPTETAIVMSLK
jgi:ribosomal protein S18 acetylase RimI-like enzyme